jgi:FKBP-type peptidyl-prolyl cis-trans isomerase 2
VGSFCLSQFVEDPPMQARFFVSYTLLISTLVFSSTLPAEEEKEVIEQGKTVAFEYRLSLDDGTVVESNVDSGQPFEYVQGGGQILPALEAALEGLSENDKKSVKLAAEDAYGPVNAEAFQEVPRDRIPDEALSVGTQLSAPGYEGPIRVHEVKDDSVVLDFNHPLAGQALTFDIRVVSVAD